MNTYDPENQSHETILEVLATEGLVKAQLNQLAKSWGRGLGRAINLENLAAFWPAAL